MTESRPQRVRKGGNLASAQRNRRTLINQPERMAQIKRLVDDQVSMREITRTTGASWRVLHKYFPEAGWEPGSRPGRKAILRLEREVGLR